MGRGTTQTEQTVDRVLVPVGMSLGVMHDGADRPPRRVVRVGEEMHSLTRAQAWVWDIVHAPAEDASGPRRLGVETAVARRGVDGEAAVQSSVERGVLYELDFAPPALRAFCDSHRIVPVARGLGNSSDDLETFSFGYADGELARTGPLMNEVLRWSAAYGSISGLLSALLPDDTDDLAELVVRNLHSFIATHTLFLDRIEQHA